MYGDSALKPGGIIYYNKGEEMGSAYFGTTIATMRESARSYEAETYNRRLSPVDGETKKPTITDIANSQISAAVKAVEEAQAI